MKQFVFLIFSILIFPFVGFAQQPASGSGVVPPIGSGGRVSMGAKLPVKLEWVTPKSPAPGKFIEVYKKLNIEVKAFTEAELRDGNFKVFVDNKPKEDKSGEVPLFADKVKKEYIFRCSVVIPSDESRHSIRVECDNNGTVERTKTLIVQSTLTPPSVNITWKSPDVTELGGRPYLQTDPFIEISADIETGGTALDLSQVIVKHNGVDYTPNSSNASLKPSGSRYSFRYKHPMLNSADLQTMLISVEGIESDILNIRYSSSKKPNLYILAIGTQTNLTYTVQDAIDFANLFQGQKSGNTMYQDVSVELLTKAAASTQDIRKSVNRLITKMNTTEINPNDLIIVFISTHGFISSEGDLRLQGDDFSSDAADATSVSFEDDIMKVMKRLNCKKLVFMDACHSGGAFDARNGGKASPSDVESALSKYNEFRSGTAILASSQGSELSYEDAKWKNGAFTEAIIKGLGQGEADTAPKDNKVTINELSKYLERNVPDMVRAVKGQGKSQKPRLFDPDMIKELPIFIVK
jgi:hypothetical protein